ncbi:conserved hypothetical protein; putative signal peptide [Bradyrhizobium sp. ORS 278]|uniref:hypothetical protein n=1 Tax=Bradyrhizobium sp. (strain ORS 278) TaxID=114615 RepID=UPI0001507883|nr:hypothetical protein [Bradyrhizobium sp. ORS 278]CAL75320.1 conserved hypothetical protein; putative signal peptide [Bradyrhizobium sp. ORS 278]
MVVGLALLCCSSLAYADESPPLERGTAILEPSALRALDSGPFGLGRMLAKAGDAPLTDAALFALPSMQPVRKGLEAEFDRYVEAHNATLPNESIGVGNAYAFQLFDRAMLDSPDARFLLAGVVNRMDRAFVDPEHCGEVRLLYRLTRTTPPEARNGEVASPRLPMTLNIVLTARSDAEAKSNMPSCADIAKRWLATSDLQLTGPELAAKLTAPDGPLALIRPENIHRIETNLQIAHAPKSAIRDFRTDYMMKVFDYQAASRTFEEAVLEDQIDRDRLLADAALAGEFKAWLLDPVHLGELDRGMAVIPDKFLAKVAVAPTPTGFVNSDMLPAYGLVQSEAGGAGVVFSEADVVGALEKAAAQGVALQNIQSVAGFERRLNDSSCGGCHQTRGIGGFHFPGVDWMAEKPSNTVVVPGSPHFFGDQVRRRDILTAFAEGRTPDFSRGFASRPQLRGSDELSGTVYNDGWGGHCYANRDGADNDKSFSRWTCAANLSCQTGPATRFGMCFIATR